MKKTINGQATEQSVEEMFVQRQRNHAVSVPKGIVSAEEHRMASVQSTQNAMALRQQDNDRRMIEMQNVMLTVKDLQSQFDRVIVKGDGEMNIEFTIE